MWKKGCWELYASDRALLEQYKEKTGKNNITLKEFFEALKRNQPEARAVWEEYLNYLAVGIQNIILILDPHYIVIGGEISRYDEILEPLKEKVFIENTFYSKQDIKIMTSTLKGNASLLGASLLPLQKLFFIREKII
ncbi:putative NBD/HSP70 family sugar kinase [Defluviitalea raffinosedens]|nr:ROK family protein [Defluviitalea raffinosedens]MBM7685024.1 putative NBD/HSP70 family sugar kinase [Defluviitalea raffinosedens]